MGIRFINSDGASSVPGTVLGAGNKWKIHPGFCLHVAYRLVRNTNNKELTNVMLGSDHTRGSHQTHEQRERGVGRVRQM